MVSGGWLVDWSWFVCWCWFVCWGRLVDRRRLVHDWGRLVDDWGWLVSRCGMLGLIGSSIAIVFDVSHVASISIGICVVGHCLGAAVREQDRVRACDCAGVRRLSLAESGS